MIKTQTKKNRIWVDKNNSLHRRIIVRIPYKRHQSIYVKITPSPDKKHSNVYRHEYKVYSDLSHVETRKRLIIQPISNLLDISRVRDLLNCRRPLKVPISDLLKVTDTEDVLQLDLKHVFCTYPAYDMTLPYNKKIDLMNLFKKNRINAENYDLFLYEGLSSKYITLENFLLKKPSNKQMKRCIYDFIDSLIYLHKKKKFFHGDLHIANILVHTEKQNTVIFDFDHSSTQNTPISFNFYILYQAMTQNVSNLSNISPSQLHQMVCGYKGLLYDIFRILATVLIHNEKHINTRQINLFIESMIKKIDITKKQILLKDLKNLFKISKELSSLNDKDVNIFISPEHFIYIFGFTED